jgi:Zn-dependent M28 family amino/carboxypeptidase
MKKKLKVQSLRYNLYYIGQNLFALCLLISILFSIISCTSADSSEPPKFDANRAFEYLQKQCDFGPRPPGSVAHEKTLNYLISELSKFSTNVETQKFTQKVYDKTLKLTNIIATFGKKNGEKILLAAHWDTRPIADRDPNPENQHKPILGANDGASGVAVLLEIARILHSNPPDKQIIIVLFDGEDYGRTIDNMLLGSKYFAQNMKAEWKPDYGILIDMIGDKDLDIYVEPYSEKAAPDIVKRVWRLADKLKLDGFYHGYGPAILDDHIPLIEAGIKCIDIIDFNYPYWHSLEDTPNKCSPKSLESVGRLLLSLIYGESS